jgi:ISXO2-like transposase domain
MAQTLFSIPCRLKTPVNRKVPGEKGICLDNNPHPATPKAKVLTSEADFEGFANEVLFHLYPKYCPEHNLQLSRLISTRPYAIKCPKCRHQQSRFSYTPFHHLKLPVWQFGWAIWESLHRYPAVLSSSEIRRRLGIGANSALLLKRRLQLFATQQMPRIKELMQHELKERFSGVRLPNVSENKNVNQVLHHRPVPQADSMVLFSASQRSNQGRKRHKHTGQTASIYLSDKLGGAQVGTLVHTLSWKGGPVLYDSISNNKGETLRPLLDNYVPKDAPIFTDEGYKFYYRINRNHRMVNHSRKSEDKRFKWARNRWSINGIHNQVAEGNHRNLKWHFTAGYTYIKPEYSQLYLNEYAFWKNVKYYGWDKLIRTEAENKSAAESRRSESLSEANTGIGAGIIQGDLESYLKPGQTQTRPEVSEPHTGQNNGAGGVKGIGYLEEITKNTGVTKQILISGYPGTSFADLPPRGVNRGVGIRRTKYTHKGWLKETLSKAKFIPLSMEERKVSPAPSNDELSGWEFEPLLENPEYANLKLAIGDFRDFSRRKRKHESEMQKQYEYYAQRLWGFLEDHEWADLDSLISASQVPRAKAYRIIRQWAIAGIASVVDRSCADGFNFKLIYDLRKTISALPPIRYVLSRSEFSDYESLYGKFISKQYVQRKVKAKY